MSKKLFKEIFKKYKTKIIKLINKYYEEKIKKKFYGADPGPDPLTLDAKDKNFLSISKSSLCKIFNWDKKKRLQLFFYIF